MIKVVIKSIALFLVLYTFLIVVSSFDNKTLPDNSSVVRVNVAKEYTSLDYLFIGPSFTYDAINPLVFDSLGYKTYNLGVATAGPYFYEIVIDDYIKASPSKPKNLIINVSLLTFCDASDNWGKYPIHRYLNEPLKNEYIYWNYSSIQDYIKMMRNSFGKSVNSFVTKQNDNELRQTDFAAIRKYKGFTPQTAICNDSTVKADAPEYKGFLSFSCPNEKKVKALIQLIKKYNQQGIQTILFDIPVNKGVDFFTDEYKKKYEETCNELRKEGFQFFHCGLELDDTCFSNIDHMNLKGAAIYTNYLIQQLALKAKQSH